MSARAGMDAALLDDYERSLATRPAHTRAAYLRDVAALKALAGEAPLTALSAADLRRFLATLHGRGLTGRSLARLLSGWRAFFRFAMDRDDSFKDNPCAGLKAPKSQRRLPSALSPDEAVQLVAIEGDDALAIRDRALLELAYSSGLRVAELSGLNLSMLDLASGRGPRLGQGIQGAHRPGRRAGARRAGGVDRMRAGFPIRDAEALFLSRTRPAPGAARHPAASRGLGGQARIESPRASPHAAALVRLASAAVIGRSARGAGASRSHQHRQHAGLHAPRLPVSGQGVRRGASARPKRRRGWQGAQSREIRKRAIGPDHSSS